MPTNGMTIDGLNTVSSLTAQDEVPVWDKEASGEPTRKITAQNMTNSVKTLGSLVNTTEMNNAIAQSTADVIRTGDVVNSLTSTNTDKPLSAAQGKALNDRLANTLSFHEETVTTNQYGVVALTVNLNNVVGIWVKSPDKCVAVRANTANNTVQIAKLNNASSTADTWSHVVSQSVTIQYSYFDN